MGPIERWDESSAAPPAPAVVANPAVLPPYDGDDDIPLSKINEPEETSILTPKKDGKGKQLNLSKTYISKAKLCIQYLNTSFIIFRYKWKSIYLFVHRRRSCNISNINNFTDRS